MSGGELDRAQVVDRVRAFIRDEVLLEDDVDLTGSQPLMGGLIDSMGVLVLVGFIEDTFDIEVGAADVTAANLGTIDAMARFIMDRRSGHG